MRQRGPKMRCGLPVNRAEADMSDCIVPLSGESHQFVANPQDGLHCTAVRYITSTLRRNPAVFCPTVAFCKASAFCEQWQVRSGLLGLCFMPQTVAVQIGKALGSALTCLSWQLSALDTAVQFIHPTYKQQQPFQPACLASPQSPDHSRHLTLCCPAVLFSSDLLKVLPPACKLTHLLQIADLHSLSCSCSSQPACV